MSLKVAIPWDHVDLTYILNIKVPVPAVVFVPEMWRNFAISALRKLFFIPHRDIVFSPILGHSEKVVKREIKSLSSYIIHPWPWGTSCCSSSSATSHFSSFQLQAFICSHSGGQYTDTETFFHQVFVEVWISLRNTSRNLIRFPVQFTSLLSDANANSKIRF